MISKESHQRVFFFGVEPLTVRNLLINFAHCDVLGHSPVVLICDVNIHFRGPQNHFVQHCLLAVVQDFELSRRRSIRCFQPVVYRVGRQVAQYASRLHVYYVMRSILQFAMDCSELERAS